MQCITHGKTLNLPSSAKDIINTLGLAVYEATGEQKQAAQLVIDRIQEHHQPCDREWLKGAIYTLLQHYFVKDLPEQVQKAIAQDWIEILSKYPDWAIETARLRYLEYGDKRKPLPKDMSLLCVDAMKKNNSLLKHCRNILNAPEPSQYISQDERDEALRKVEELKKKIGL